MRNINTWRVVYIWYHSFLSTGNSPPTLLLLFFRRTTISHLPPVGTPPHRIAVRLKKTYVGGYPYDIMFGRGWLCIIERGRLFWYSWAVQRLRWFVPLLQREPARNVYIYYYNNNINIKLYIRLCAYRVMYICLLSVDFCIWAFHRAALFGPIVNYSNSILFLKHDFKKPTFYTKIIVIYHIF